MTHKKSKQAAWVKTALLFLLTPMLNLAATAQSIPGDSLYFGQKPPGDSAIAFSTPIGIPTGGKIPCITFSPDGATASFYIAFWPNPGSPYTLTSEFKNGRWTTPANASFTIGRSTGEPSFAYNGNRIFLFASGAQGQVGQVDVSYVERSGSGWSNPISLGSPLNSAADQYHPCVVADSSVYFSTSTGDIARCQYQNGTYKTRVLLPYPINNANTTQTWGDPYVAPDESYLIFKSTRTGGYGLNDIYIAFKKADGTWTNPKNLGPKINTRYDETAGDITPDGKYMTFNSNSKLYWVSSGFIETLRSSNFMPYVKTKLKAQTGRVGEAFNLVIPDSTFIDDDGNSTLTCYITSRLPNGLGFDSDARTLSGTPNESGTFTVTLMVVDDEDASISTNFTLRISNASGISRDVLERDVKLFPNPVTDQLYLSLKTGTFGQATITITDLVGKEIYSGVMSTETTGMINLAGSPKGAYLVRVNFEGTVINKKFLLD